MLPECANCIYRAYPKIPPSKIHPAEIAIVGEAPGATEIARKAPFVGISGQLLERALVNAGIIKQEELAGSAWRRRVFITNSLLCKPPKGPIKKEAIDRCRARVMEELTQVNPRLIMALGNVSIHCLTADYKLKISQEQGRALHSDLLPYVIVPALHPAAILRRPGDYKTFIASLRYAASLLNGGEILDPGVTEWTVARTPEEVQKAIEFLSNRADTTIVAADIETTGLNPRQDRAIVIGVAYDKNKVIVFPQEAMPLLRPLFECDRLKWGWHNGKFDTSFLRRMGLPAIVHHDSLLLHYCLNETPGTHGLEQLAAQYLGAPPYKAEANKHASVRTKKGFAGLPEPILFKRVATDADYTRQLILKLLPKVEADPNLRKLYYKILLPASAFLRRVERNGMYVNRAVLRDLKQQYSVKLDSMANMIVGVVGPWWNPELYKRDTGAKTAPQIFNPGSPPQLAWLLYDRLGLRLPRKMKRSTRKEALKQLRGQHAVVELIEEYRSAQKELTTYILGVEKRLTLDSRAHTTFLLHGTSTGRLSSRDPNLQNIPKRKVTVRNMFQAPPGKLLLEADYKGAELRVLAHLSGDKFLKEVFIEERDLHDEVSKALNIERVRAKALNFGIPYGRKAFSIAEEFNISVEEAQKMIDDWFERAPEAAAYLESNARAVIEGRVLVTPFGRMRRFGLITPENLDELQNEARNFPIQSVASDLTLLSAIKLEPMLRPLGVKIINLVHDSILFELPNTSEEIVRETSGIVKGVMIETPKVELGSEVPFDADISVGVEWGNLSKPEEGEFDDFEEVEEDAEDADADV